ncbi:MAG TPA: antibiotic biosynthesis monooxygenase [Pseudolabrys sp.]|nr:antibiotic biosynthesis monooxygenase [Pseudolabrys sp.]
MLRLMSAAAAALLLVSAGSIASAQEAYVVSYAEANPANVGMARAALRQYRNASRKEDGNVRVEILQNIFRPQQFAVLEAWKDDKARETHAAAASAKALHEHLSSVLTAPYDERPHGGLAVSQFKGAAGSVYAVTHVDFVGAKKDDGIAALKTLAAASVKDRGNIRYDVLQQTSRPNHLTLVEVWHGVQALEGHEAAAHTKTFRNDALPMTGALYDQRLYRLVN